MPIRGGAAVLLLREDALEDYARDEAALRRLAEEGAIPGEGPKQVLTLGPARDVSQLRRIRFRVSFSGIRIECLARSGTEVDTIRSYSRLHLPGTEVELVSSPLLPSFKIPKPGQLPAGKRRLGLLMLILGCLLLFGAPFASGKTWVARRTPGRRHGCDRHRRLEQQEGLRTVLEIVATFKKYLRQDEAVAPQHGHLSSRRRRFVSSFGLA